MHGSRTLCLRLPSNCASRIRVSFSLFHAAGAWQASEPKRNGTHGWLMRTPARILFLRCFFVLFISSLFFILFGASLRVGNGFGVFRRYGNGKRLLTIYVKSSFFVAKRVQTSFSLLAQMNCSSGLYIAYITDLPPHTLVQINAE